MHEEFKILRSTLEPPVQTALNRQMPIILLNVISLKNIVLILKWYYDEKIIYFFSSDFESVFTQHPTGKILSFAFYLKAVYFECKFWISWSVITHVQK